MKNALRAILLIFILLNGASCFAQVPAASSGQTPEYSFDKRLLLHYSEEELLEMKNSNYQKYLVVEYYYTQSYIIELFSCTDCAPLDVSTFDISKMEEMRKKSERVEFTYNKYGYKLILLSRDELLYKTPYQIAKDE